VVRRVVASRRRPYRGAMSYDTVTQQAPAAPPTRSGLRTAARVTAVVLSLLLIAYGVLSVVGLIARDTAHRSATFGGITSLTVDLGFESLEVRGSSTASSVRMTRSYSWSFDQPSVGAAEAGGRLTVRSDCGFSVGRGCTGHVRLVVPEGLPVTVRTSDGSVLLRDLTGSVTSSTSDGHVTLRNLSGAVDASSSDGGMDVSEVTGRLTLRTRDGSIHGSGLRTSRVTAESSDGGIDLRFAAAPDRVQVQSRDGSIGVHVPDDGTSYRVTVAVSDGHQDVSVPTDPGAARQIDVQASDGSITVDTITVDTTC
jgi:hypothetical protein